MKRVALEPAGGYPIVVGADGREGVARRGRRVNADHAEERQAAEQRAEKRPGAVPVAQFAAMVNS